MSLSVCKIWPVTHVKIWLWVSEAEIFLECIGQVLLGLGVGGNMLVPTWAWSADGGTFWPLLTACIFPAWTDGRQRRERRRVWAPCTAGPISGTLSKVSPFPGSFSNHKWPQQDQWLVVNVLTTQCSRSRLRPLCLISILEDETFQFSTGLDPYYQKGWDENALKYTFPWMQSTWSDIKDLMFTWKNKQEQTEKWWERKTLRGCVYVCVYAYVCMCVHVCVCA